MKRSWHQNFKRAPKINRTSRDGDVFDSKTELMRWEYLRLRVRTGQIRNLKRQVRYEMVLPSGWKIMAGNRISHYTADFVYEASEGEEWTEVIEEVKGHFDKASKFRISVFEACHGKKVSMVSLKNNRWIVA